jgi:hypothetical protein
LSVTLSGSSRGYRRIRLRLYSPYKMQIYNMIRLE